MTAACLSFHSDCTTFNYYMNHSPIDIKPPIYDVPPAVSRCVVCNEQADGIHFGALVCAACGAFFRRSVANQKVYVCPYDRRCSLMNDRKMSWAEASSSCSSSRIRGGVCRYCRFQRCLHVGMRTEEVQAKRVAGMPGRPQRIPFSTRTDVSYAMEDFIARRREMAIRRITVNEPNGTEDVKSCVTAERTLFAEFVLSSPILIEILSEKNNIPYSPTSPFRSSFTPICKPDEFNELFLHAFLFECTLSTCVHGGVQIDNLILPNGLQLPLEEDQLTTFYSSGDGIRDPAFYARSSQNFFYSVVRVSARTLQSLHMDQNEIAWLYTYFISTAVIPRGHSPFRDRLMHLPTSLEETCERFGNLLLLLSPLYESLFHLRQFLALLDLNRIHLTPQ